MAAEAGCHATQIGFLSKTAGEADGVLNMTNFCLMRSYLLCYV